MASFELPSELVEIGGLVETGFGLSCFLGLLGADEDDRLALTLRAGTLLVRTKEPLLLRSFFRLLLVLFLVLSVFNVLLLAGVAM